MIVFWLVSNMFNKYKKQHKKTQKAINKFGITSEEAKASFGLEVFQLYGLLRTDNDIVLEINYNNLTLEIHIPDYSWQLDDYMSELQKAGEVYAFIFN